MLDPTSVATRFVSSNGDSAATLADNLSTAPIYSTLADALAASVDNDIIEIL